MLLGDTGDMMPRQISQTLGSYLMTIFMKYSYLIFQDFLYKLTPRSWSSGTAGASG